MNESQDRRNVGFTQTEHSVIRMKLIPKFSILHFIQSAVIDFTISPFKICICGHVFHESRQWPKAQSVVIYNAQRHWWYTWVILSLNR